MTSRILIVTTLGVVRTDPMNDIDAEATWRSISDAVARCIGVVVHTGGKRHVINGRHIVEWYADEAEPGDEDHPHSPRDADGNTHPDAYWEASDG